MQLQSRETVEQEVVVFDYPKSKYHLQLARKKEYLYRHLKKVLRQSPDNKVLVFVGQQKL